MEIEAFIFDLDGVLTDTAEYHFRAWKRLADEEGIPFTRRENERLRGVSRRESLEILLSLKGREVTEEEAEEMMARKNRYYQELIEQITPEDLLPGAMELLGELRKAGIKIAVASASKNARTVLDHLGIMDHIDALSDGYSVTASKPAPDLFLHAAAQLGVPPERCVVVEDAAAGIRAARAAGMWSIALGPRERFRDVLPDLILPSLEGATLSELLRALERSARLWTIREESFNPERQRQMETVFTIGNGYLGTRGTFEERYPGDQRATLIHGLYDDAPIVHTELVNCPDWLAFDLLVDGERFSMDRGEVLSYERSLDLRDGVLTREVRWRSPKGHIVVVNIERWASLADEHLCAISYTVTAVNFAGEVELQAGIDGAVFNPGVLHPAGVGLAHWTLLDYGNPELQIIYIHMGTDRSGLELCQAASLRVRGGGDVKYAFCECPLRPAVAARFRLRPGESATAIKLVSVFTSREAADPVKAALEGLKRASSLGYEALLAMHRAAWADLWGDADILIEGDDEAQLAVRFNLFHLLIAAPRHDGRVSIPAKGLTGFGYRGHVFWDSDIFALPFFTFTQPKLARNLLMYRYHTLPGARGNARRRGYEGAMYAWESALSGEEVTPRWVPGPNGELVRVWCGDIELHITADVAYAVWQYWKVTGDDAFMRDQGAEIILDTAVFWGSRVEYDPEKDRYEIRDVMGPDEYHIHVDNSAYTNCMVRHNLKIALEVLEWLQRAYPDKAAELKERLKLDEGRLAHWAKVIKQMYVPYDPESGIIEQFDGFFELEDLTFRELELRREAGIARPSAGIEHLERTQIIKQPDVLMLLHLLGDLYDARTKRVNWDYYEPRTDRSRGSSLGPAIHAIIGCEVGELEKAYEYFMQAAQVDLHDRYGNTEAGIHIASAGGVWQAIVFGFAGLKLTPEGPLARPRLPDHWRRLRFVIYYRGERVEIDLQRR